MTQRSAVLPLEQSVSLPLTRPSTVVRTARGSPVAFSQVPRYAPKLVNGWNSVLSSAVVRMPLPRESP
ncbi:hypothetical protein [Streptomyces sp. NPDC059015]|uniref:hypothetical protein n=1 Tax=unclassified Streptomyces TaxID=2593676 RepID=UPI0036C14270